MVAFFSSHLVTHNTLRSDFLYLYFFKENIFYIPLKIGRKQPLSPSPGYIFKGSISLK